VQNIFREHPKLISFGIIECCALRRAYSNRIHSHLINELTEVLGLRVVHSLGSIFRRTRRLGFVPKQEHILLYSSLVTAETNYLEALDITNLDCKHTKEEHIIALKNICSLLQPGEPN